MTPTSRDVAELLLAEHGPMETWKLQKLVYFVQAWSLVDLGAPAFDDEIQAFRDGPVARDLFHAHQGRFSVDHIPGGHAEQVHNALREVVERVWDEYGGESPRALRELTHAELAWIEAREGLAPNEISDRPLSLATMGRTTRVYREATAKLPKPHRGEGILDYLSRAAAAAE